MIPIIPTPQGAIEIVEARHLRGKVFETEGGKRQVVSGNRVAHVPDDVAAWEAGGSFNWLDIDTDVEFRGGLFRPKRTWSDVTIDPTVLGYEYFSRRIGDVRVEVTRINDIGVSGPLPVPRVSGPEVWFDSVIPGLSFAFEFYAARIRAFRVLRSSSGPAPLSLQWNFSRAADDDIIIAADASGRDNFERTDPIRQGGSKFNEAREVELINSRTGDRPVGGRTVFTSTEIFTGRTVFTRPVDRVKELRDEFVFPVRISG